MKTSYKDALLEGYKYLLRSDPRFFVLGQGVTSPWYVGGSMQDLDKEFGKDRVMEAPVSEEAMTSIGAGASLCGFRVMVVHPRVDFMLLATNSIVNQIAKWSHMLGGEDSPGLTIRAIINRGGEQGAQHSQALHAWYAHIPGIRVVTPATPSDARDLLISSVLCPDPVIFIDDRWCYESEAELGPVKIKDLKLEGPKLLHQGRDLTVVSSGYSTQLAMSALSGLQRDGLSFDVIDLRVINPLRPEIIYKSVEKTGRLLVLDGGWSPCGLAGEIIALTTETLSPTVWKAKPKRITLPFAPAPSSGALERIYYPSEELVQSGVRDLLNQ